MASTYTTRIRLEKQGDGENANSWGLRLNQNVIDLVDEAVAGYKTIDVTGATSISLTTGNGTDDEARNFGLNFVGTLTADCTVNIPAVEKIYFVNNKTTGDYNVLMKPTGGTAVTVARAMIAATTGTTIDTLKGFSQESIIGTVSINGDLNVTGTVSATTVTATDVIATNIGATNVSATTVSATNVRSASVSATNVQGDTVSATDVVATNIGATNVSATTVSATNVRATNVTATNVRGTTVSATNVRSASVTATNIRGTTVSAGAVISDTMTTDTINVSTRIYAATVAADNIGVTSITTTRTLRFSTGASITGSPKINAGAVFCTALSVTGFPGGTSPVAHIFNTASNTTSDSRILELSFLDSTVANNADFVVFKGLSTINGRIQSDGDGTISYVTTSDERVKENIVDADSQWETIKNINVRNYDLKLTGDNRIGFIAQELYEHAPQCVSEGGDDVNENPWSVDYGKLTPYLTKALQEAIEKIENLEERLSNVEENN